MEAEKESNPEETAAWERADGASGKCAEREFKQSGKSGTVFAAAGNRLSDDCKIDR